MTRSIPLVLMLAACSTAGPVPSGGWVARNLHEVYPIENGVFEVVSRPGSGPADFWCAAGDFTRRQLATSGTQRIHIWRGIGPSDARAGYRSVQFSLSPPPGGYTDPGRITLSVKARGDNLSSAMAFQYCLGDDPFERSDPLRRIN